MTIPAHRRAFGEHLRALRQANGHASQEAFAHHVGLDRTYISGLERGARNPTLDVIVKLARGLDVSPAEMLATIDA
ncbi:transcriptional regulator with XRE-family HTH domain [Microbacterium natoriense]|uniref:Transcriptional regulator with XRE-family HTH domain n=1 Tax=Microbacterium natoriense TaxID=284570 RepID=A0AAW8EZA9_9MICO|nr:helix-turn-helix transcriptional regulator [Microbacterium natoriense]MDQ0648651.1 transcriptional regulator with XRE-family HTH domain [Microbacterium natoriense]